MNIDWKDDAEKMRACFEGAIYVAEIRKNEIKRLKQALETIRDIGTAEVMKIANDALNGEPK
jgi:hypothetical protein